MSILKRHMSSIAGLPAELTALQQSIAAEAQARAAADGDLQTLTTDEKGSLVGAINEAVTKASSGAGSLKVTENLADLADASAARDNLDVLSSSEVNQAIAQAQLGVGTNFTVADITARDALEGLDVADRVLVKDDGDGKWAMYTPEAVVDGVVQGWTKLYDQDALENSITAEGIKMAYESNADTNAFTDAEKVRVAAAFTAQDLVTEINESADDNQVPSALAVKTLVDNATAAISSEVAVALQTVVVAEGAITLANAPKGGLQGVLNFGTVRYISQEGVAYDAPLVATADPLVFTVSTDTANQWDGNSVQVQYLHEVTAGV